MATKRVSDLKSDWIRTFILMGTVLVALGVNYATTNASVSHNTESIERITTQLDKTDSQVETLTVDVAVTKTIVTRIETKIDKALDKEYGHDSRKR